MPQKPKKKKQPPDTPSPVPEKKEESDLTPLQRSALFWFGMFMALAGVVLPGWRHIISPHVEDHGTMVLITEVSFYTVLIVFGSALMCPDLTIRLLRTAPLPSFLKRQKSTK